MRIKTDDDRDGNAQDQQVLVIGNLGSEGHACISDCLTTYNFSLDSATPTVVDVEVSFGKAPQSMPDIETRFCSSMS